MQQLLVYQLNLPINATIYFFDKVDVNVARIAVRLGWVPLKALPGSLQFHLIEE
jgi:endonuclease III